MFLSGVFLLGQLYFACETHYALRAAIAEADRTDPRWRWQDLQAKRKPVPDAENGTLQILAAKKLVPENRWFFANTLKFPNERQLEKRVREYLISKFEMALSELPPTVLLNAQQLEAVAGELKQWAQVLAVARKMVNYSRGRYTYPQGKSALLGPNESYSTARTLAFLLHYDAMVQAHHQRPDKALESCRSILHIGKVVGDEVDTTSPLVRAGISTIAVYTVERALAQGQAMELEGIQELLGSAEKELPFLEAARADRAIAHRVFEEIAAQNQHSIRVNLFLGRNNASHWETFVSHYTREFQGYWGKTLQKGSHHVRIAKLPLEMRHRALKALWEQPAIPGVYLFFPKIGLSSLRVQMKLRTARVAVAVERFRLGNGRWPGKLTDLVPNYLAEVPGDFYGKGPLLYVKRKDGVVIYSVGPDGVDNGGRVQADPNELVFPPDFESLDFGFRLWDLASRR